MKVVCRNGEDYDDVSVYVTDHCNDDRHYYAEPVPSKLSGMGWMLYASGDSPPPLFTVPQSVAKLLCEALNFHFSQPQGQPKDAQEEKPAPSHFPGGITPEDVRRLQRMQELNAAISRYLGLNKPPPMKWLFELQRLGYEAQRHEIVRDAARKHSVQGRWRGEKHGD